MSTSINKIAQKIRFSTNKAKGYSSFNNGIQVQDADINRWVRECIFDIQEQVMTGFNDVNPSAHRSQGNTIVTCIAHQKEKDVYELTVVVAKDYFSAVIPDFNPINDYEFVKVENSEAGA